MTKFDDLHNKIRKQMQHYEEEYITRYFKHQSQQVSNLMTMCSRVQPMSLIYKNIKIIG